MTAGDAPLDYVDYTSISFPSDRVTMADVRRAHPERFDVEDGDAFERTGDDPTFTLGLVVYLERLLARAAYESSLGKPGNVIGQRGMDRADCVEELTKFYATYGVANGSHQTEELVRDIESQAAAQAAGRPR